jgi:hypothetical protein
VLCAGGVASALELVARGVFWRSSVTCWVLFIYSIIMCVASLNKWAKSDTLRSCHLFDFAFSTARFREVNLQRGILLPISFVENALLSPG